MRCKQIEKLLTPLLDDRLDGDRKAQVEEHLQGCEGCAETHRLLAATQQSLRALGPAEPADDLAARAARAAFTAEPEATVGWLDQLVSSLRWPALGAAAASVLLAVGLFTAVPEQVTPSGVSTDTVAAALMGDDEEEEDEELLSAVLGQEVE